MNWYEKIKKYYSLKLWDRKMVGDAVTKGVITQEQFDMIVNTEVSQNDK
ncbi:XkdX family protein [Dielma fastidiosa]|nr:XkdX family protein [Dielma fastidiosa]